jgi:hypothetical protein
VDTIGIVTLTDIGTKTDEEAAHRLEHHPGDDHEAVIDLPGGLRGVAMNVLSGGVHQVLTDFSRAIDRGAVTDVPGDIHQGAMSVPGGPHQGAMSVPGDTHQAMTDTIPPGNDLSDEHLQGGDREAVIDVTGGPH